MNYGKLINSRYLVDAGVINSDATHLIAEGFEVLVNGRVITKIQAYVGNDANTFLVTHREPNDFDGRYYQRYYRNEELKVEVYQVERTKVYG